MEEFGEAKIMYEIEARDLHYCLVTPTTWFGKEKSYHARQLLRNVSLRAQPGRILAIAGPSGAGKSTLLDILAGKIRPTSSTQETMLINGVPMESTHIRKISAYVTQEDALLPLLTVKESIFFAAQLRMRGTTSSVRAQRVQEMLKDLGLSHAADIRVGGVSGGERRRVSIAVEIVHDPSVLFLDEPTSGLDSRAALQVIKILRKIASEKLRTVVLTIHQPGTRILDMLDAVVLLSEGRVLHYGTLSALRRTITAFNCDPVLVHVNTLEYALDNISSLQRKTPKQRSKVTLYDLFHTNENSEDSKGTESGNPAREIFVLSRRFCLIIYRTKELFTVRLLQAGVAGLCLGTIYHTAKTPPERMGLMAFSLTFLMSSTIEGLPMFVREMPVVSREASSGAYRVSSYAVASALVYLPFMLVIALAFSLPVYFLAGLTPTVPAFFYFVLVMWLAIYSANSMVSVFSAAVPDYIMGTTLITGAMGAFFLFSGFFVLKTEMPVYWLFVHYLSLFKYPLEALLMNEYGRQGKRECLESALGECVLSVQDIMKEQGLRDESRWINVVIMIGFICFYRLLGYAFLRIRCSVRARGRLPSYSWC